MEELLQIRNLGVTFDTDLGEVQAVKDADFSVRLSSAKPSQALRSPGKRRNRTLRKKQTPGPGHLRRIAV